MVGKSGLQSTLKSFLERIDVFESRIPQFNLQGREKIGSVCGGLMSIVMAFFLVIYALLKLQIYLTRGNPQILEVTEGNGIDSQEKLNLKQKGFRFAWAFEGSWDRDLKDDPRYVKQYVRVAGRKAGKSFAKLLNFHRCTDEEMDEFPNPTYDTQITLNKVKKDKNRGLYCLNWDELDAELDIFGKNTYEDF